MVRNWVSVQQQWCSTAVAKVAAVEVEVVEEVGVVVVILAVVIALAAAR